MVCPWFTWLSFGFVPRWLPKGGDEAVGKLQSVCELYEVTLLWWFLTWVIGRILNINQFTSDRVVVGTWEIGQVPGCDR